MCSRRELARFPNLLVEPDLATVQMVRPVVHRERVFLAVQGELALRNAVGHAPGDGAEERMALRVFLELVEAEHDVARLARAVGRPQLRDDAAILGDLDLHAEAVDEGVNLDRRAVGHLAESIDLDHGFVGRSGMKVVTAAEGHQRRGGQRNQRKAKE